MDRTRIRELGTRCLIIGFVTILFFNCKQDPNDSQPEHLVVAEPQDIYEFGFNLNDYIVKRDTIQKGDSFGEILERNHIGYPQIYQIAEKAKDTFDIRKLQVGKPYTLLCTKGDSLEKPKCFIYQPNKEEYVVINFQDSIHAYTSRKPIKYVEKEATGIITSNISDLHVAVINVICCEKCTNMSFFPFTVIYSK